MRRGPLASAPSSARTETENEAPSGFSTRLVRAARSSTRNRTSAVVADGVIESSSLLAPDTAAALGRAVRRGFAAPIWRPSGLGWRIGRPQDHFESIADFLRGVQDEILADAVASGAVTIVGEAYTDGWLPANAQRNMEQILTAQDNKVDAVVASNDGTAGGVVAALTAQGMEGLPVSGQDGDHAALNRVARGEQTVSVWKNALDLGSAAADIAVALAGGASLDSIDGAVKWSGGANGVEMNAIFLDVLDQDAATLRRVNDLVRHLTMDQRGQLRPIRLLLLRPSVDLAKLASQYELQLDGVLAHATRGLGSRQTKSPDWLSMLLFDRAYTPRLVDIGYADARAQHARLARFFEYEKA